MHPGILTRTSCLSYYGSVFTSRLILQYLRSHHAAPFHVRPLLQFFELVFCSCVSTIPPSGDKLGVRSGIFFPAEMACAGDEINLGIGQTVAKERRIRSWNYRVLGTSDNANRS